MKMENLIILKSNLTTLAKVTQHNKCLCSISGGSDYDIMLDICSKNDPENKIHYVFYDTGLEFAATKKHLDFLESKYGITIERRKASKPVPLCVHKYGVPFLSKQISGMIERLQNHGFNWENEPFEVLIKKYPKCKAALRWWCNGFGEGSRFNIEYRKGLKEFLISNPPTFKISNKCCQYAKKNTAHSVLDEDDYDLNIVGVRKAEGGARKTAYKNCFTPATDMNIAQYRPIFWYTNDDKECYDSEYGITHSDCYTKWGLKRTGCSGCPYARDIDKELNAVERFEPKLYKALMNTFGRSYEYTKQYREFANSLKKGK